jgi:hypothetical protein
MPDPAKAVSPWRNTPPLQAFIFLVAVFFLFASFGFDTDVSGLGRQPVPRFALSVLVSGLFAVGYAAGGIALRGRFWKVLLPLLAVQFVVMAALGHWLPDPPRLAQMGIADVDRLENRLAFDCIAAILSVCLGYAGFVHVFIHEGRRHIRVNTEKAVLEAEMSAAREVQQVILPEQGEIFPGFEIESVYRPAKQVGGDFFQILSTGDGGLLIVVGDVAGKGLKAGMMVALLVGSIRTAARFDLAPVDLLKELNQRLLGRGDAPATCLALRIAGNGAVTLANAGHLPPYLNGEPMAMEGALPLGMTEDAGFSVMRFQLKTGDKLIFMSDGIVEATDSEGQLFGFERIRGLLAAGLNAALVAKAAQDFGQQDDISVMSVTRTALPA